MVSVCPHGPKTHHKEIEMSIEQMCADAQTRITQHINRSTGQHLRAMKSQATLKALDALYDIGCKYAITNADMKPLCESVGIAFDDLMNHYVGKPCNH